MSCNTRTAPAESRLAPAHECPWCRSLDVAVVVALPAGHPSSGARALATGRCAACGRDVPLVPLGYAC